MLSHTKIIEAAGGSVHKNIVEHFGVMELSCTMITASKDILDAFHIKSNTPLEEINSRITYLSSSEKADYLSSIIKKNHNIYHGDTTSFLIAGIKESTLLELVSSGTFKCDRLTTSKTKAATDTLYVKTKVPEDYLKAFLSLREELRNKKDVYDLSIEEFNEFNLETKAMSLILHGNVYDLYLYCIRKLKEDYEYELQNVCKVMKELLEKKEIIKVYKEEIGLL